MRELRTQLRSAVFWRDQIHGGWQSACVQVVINTSRWSIRFKCLNVVKWDETGWPNYAESLSDNGQGEPTISFGTFISWADNSSETWAANAESLVVPQLLWRSFHCCSPKLPRQNAESDSGSPYANSLYRTEREDGGVGNVQSHSKSQHQVLGSANNTSVTLKKKKKNPGWGFKL